MNTIAGAFERQTWGVDYVRPQDSLLREAGGVLISSSNDKGGLQPLSHGPVGVPGRQPPPGHVQRMRRVVIANAFSLNMMPLEVGATDLQVCKVSPEYIREEIKEAGDFASIVGHVDTAAIFSSLLGLDVTCNRATFTLEEDVVLFVGQYKGPRLPEGATTLPEGAKVEWAMVTIA